ncbi:MAG: hypothetical protein HYS43_02080 [Candidatus Liptonbacteria bacterium]|nr:hypothetical protein [Candidatus Liptonbacteria bacterium]
MNRGISSPRPRRARNSGIAAIPTVIIFGGIIAEIAIATTFLSLTFTNTALGQRLSAEAFAAAQSGAEDAILRLVRDRNYQNISGYTLSVGQATVTVTITQGSPAANQATIRSTGSSFRRRRVVQAIVTIDDVTGVVSLVSLKEITS